MTRLSRDMLKIAGKKEARVYAAPVNFCMVQGTRLRIDPSVEVTKIVVELSTEVHTAMERIGQMGDYARAHAKEAAYRQIRGYLYGDMYDKLSRARECVLNYDNDSACTLLTELLNYIHEG